ncbi:MAG: hypothetical protein ACRDTQ_18565 [Micromonosporaceae bacterium]
MSIVDDAGRLLASHEVDDSPAGYADVCTLIIERCADAGAVRAVTATDGNANLVSLLLAASGEPLAVGDPATVAQFTEAEPSNPPDPQQRATALARALQAGVLAASTQIPPEDLTDLRPVLTAHRAAAHGFNSSVAMLRDLLRELYPAALRTFPDPGDPLALAVLDRLAEPTEVTRSHESNVAAELSAEGHSNVEPAVIALQRAVAGTTPRSAACTAIGSAVRNGVASVRSARRAAATLVEVIAEHVEPRTSGQGFTAVGPVSGGPVPGAPVSAAPVSGAPAPGQPARSGPSTAPVFGGPISPPQPPAARPAQPSAQPPQAPAANTSGLPIARPQAPEPAWPAMAPPALPPIAAAASESAATASEAPAFHPAEPAPGTPTGYGFPAPNAPVSGPPPFPPTGPQLPSGHDTGFEHSSAFEAVDWPPSGGFRGSGSTDVGSGLTAGDRSDSTYPPVAGPTAHPLAMGALPIHMGSVAPDQSDEELSLLTPEELTTQSKPPADPTRAAPPPPRSSSGRLGALIEFPRSVRKKPAPPAPPPPYPRDARRDTENEPTQEYRPPSPRRQTAEEAAAPATPRNETDGDLLIFAQARSAWFSGDEPETEQPQDDWSTGADVGWDAAEAASQPSVGGTTTSGLPRRVPHANLVPGTPSNRDRQVQPISRDPARLAAHTAGYFRGWNRARNDVNEAPYPSARYQ